MRANKNEWYFVQVGNTVFQYKNGELQWKLYFGEGRENCGNKLLFGQKQTVC